MAAIRLRNLPKHQRYEGMYRRFDYYYGLGIEHETYLATSQTRTIKSFDDAVLKPERYSVNYYRAYDANILKSALQQTLIAADNNLTVPILLNNHSFTDCDIYGEHATTYEKRPRPNPKYTGQNFWDWAKNQSPWLRENYGKAFMWDGDTIEFITQDFYNTTVDRTLDELQQAHENFIHELNNLPKRGILIAYSPLRLTQPDNPGWATYLTNPRAVSMFNNGTIHINVTLPTQLNWRCEPLWRNDFVERHRRLARIIQWMEPLWIAAYGSGDPFTATTSAEYKTKFAAGSQRLAVSRYIGVGTFDTVTMSVGKILQIPRPGKGVLPWYDALYAKTAYVPPKEIGLDINFNKHWAHGLEVRLFDQMPMQWLKAILLDIVVLMDIAQNTKQIPDPRFAPIWITAATDALYLGENWSPSMEYMAELMYACGCIPLDISKEPLTPAEVLNWFQENTKYRRGWCWNKMVDPSYKVPNRTNCLCLSLCCCCGS